MKANQINRILTKMKGELLPEQLNSLKVVLEDVLEDKSTLPCNPKNNRNLVNQFISAKRIEGCSKRTEEYYFSVPPEVDNFYMANLKQIDRVKRIFSGGYVPAQKKYLYDEMQICLF